MTQEEFLNKSADRRLLDWWDASNDAHRNCMLALLKAIHKTPLGELDQFTVAKYSNQPDGWQGPRLVFAIRNNTQAGSLATTKTQHLSIPLWDRPLSACVTPNPPENPQARVICTTDNFIAGIMNQYYNLEYTVGAAIAQQRVDGRIANRQSKRPIDYDH